MEAPEAPENKNNSDLDFGCGGLGTPERFYTGEIGVPNEIRTRVSTVKGWCPRPLDDGDPRRVREKKNGDPRWT